ncbi:hypothetical protein HDV00_012168 [Rhizophlyctis rosea]|nr:hypothetical protein HDV00_012168 [Rhizophlyctis rosea]
MSRFNLILLSRNSTLHVLSLTTLTILHTLTPHLSEIWSMHLSKNDRYLTVRSNIPSPDDNDKKRTIPTVRELDVLKQTETVWPCVRGVVGYSMRVVEYPVDGDGRRGVGSVWEVLFYRGLPKDFEGDFGGGEEVGGGGGVV